jgi:hypothetical protein
MEDKILNLLQGEPKTDSRKKFKNHAEHSQKAFPLASTKSSVTQSKRKLAKRSDI